MTSSQQDAQQHWVNRFRRLTGDPAQHGPIVSEFRCACDPKSRAHESMVRGALRNMRDDCYLEDGITND